MIFSYKKNLLVDSLIGAAPVTKILHSSKPKVFFILLNNNLLAILQPRGNYFPSCSAKVPSIPLLKAQSTIFFLIPVDEVKASDSFSSIFSQTLGTPKKKVLF